MNRLIVPVLLLLLATPALAVDAVSPKVTALGGAVQDRVDAIGPVPDKVGAKESKKLVKAKEKLDGYQGENDKPDLKTLVKAGKLIWKSKTTDAAIEAAVLDLLDALIALSGSIEAAVEEIKTRIDHDLLKAKVDKILGKAKAAIDSGNAIRPENRSKAQALLTKACLICQKALAKAEKFVAKQEAGKKPPPQGIDTYGGFGQLGLWNHTGEPFDVTEVFIKLDVYVNGEFSEKIDARATVLEPERFEGWEGRVHVDSTWELVEFLETPFPDVGQKIRWVGEFIVETKQFRTFHIQYDYTWSR